MARPLRIEYPGAFYHIIQRGNEGKEIFLSEDDREKFYKSLEILFERYAVKVHAYCLMKNHYHLLLETQDPNLSKAMHFLNTSYTVYFNTKRKRFGHLFQGRYKAILVEADKYLYILSKYIHLNPVRAKIVNEPLEYDNSSYKYFILNRIAPKFLDVHFTLRMFNDKDIEKAKSSYKNFIAEDIGSEEEIIQKDLTANSLLGGEDFINKIKREFIEFRIDKEVPVLDSLQQRLSSDEIRELVEKQISNRRKSRDISIYLIRKHTQLKLKKIAQMYGNISDAGVSALYRRVSDRILKDRKLGELIKSLERMLKIET